VLLLAAAGVAGAVRIPNALRWRSENPYVESMRSVANFQEGSGRGRLVQYRQSLLMALRHPLLGVGPGNWAVEYPEHAARGDRSLSNANPGTTSNPWPSSDWIAYISERGLVATVLLTLVFAGLALGALARLVTATQAEPALRDAALMAVLLAAAVAGTFDAVLLLAIPAFIVWTAAGALWSGPPDQPDQPPLRIRPALVLLVVLLAAVAGARSAAQLTAITMHGASNRLAWLTTAAHIDPSNYRLRLQLARRGSGLGRAARCEHARAAHALYPNAAAARRLAASCD
jgi:O-antigen ligase